MNGPHRSLVQSSICALVLATLFLGCKSYTAPSFLPFGKTSDQTAKAKKKKEEVIDFGNPVSMAVVWVDSVLTPPGKPAVRGFGGRAFFYDEDGKAVRVDGDFVVYAYNDTDERFKNNVPDRKYVFRSAELQGHYTESEFGPCYNFWVPWDKAGGTRTTVTLLPQLDVADNHKVQGMQSVNVLPGTESNKSDHPLIEEITRSTTKIRSPSPTRPASYEQEEDLLAGIEPSTLNRTTIRTKTLDVPPSLARRMQMNQAMSQGQPAVAPTPTATQYPQDQRAMQPQPLNQVTYGTQPIYGTVGQDGAVSARIASNDADSAGQSNTNSAPPVLNLPGHIEGPSATNQTTSPATRPQAFGVPGPLVPR